MSSPGSSTVPYPSVERLLQYPDALLVAHILSHASSNDLPGASAWLFGPHRHDPMSTGVAPPAQRYRQLALRLHPDKNAAPQAHEAFQFVQACFDQATQHTAASEVAWCCRPDPRQGDRSTRSRTEMCPSPSAWPAPPPPPSSSAHLFHSTPPVSCAPAMAPDGPAASDCDIPLPPDVFDEVPTRTSLVVHLPSLCSISDGSASEDADGWTVPSPLIVGADCCSRLPHGREQIQKSPPQSAKDHTMCRPRGNSTRHPHRRRHLASTSSVSQDRSSAARLGLHRRHPEGKAHIAYVREVGLPRCACGRAAQGMCFMCD